MLEISSRFLYSFFALFLGVLLLMFVMFAVMVHYDPDVTAQGNIPAALGEDEEPREERGGGLRDLTPLYRANLFTINLCLIVLAETLLIVLFVKYTVPAALLATAAVVLSMMNVTDGLRRNAMPAFLSRLVTNRYATLSYTDLILLIMLSGLIMAFLISVLLKEASSDRRSEPREGIPSPPQLPPPPL